MITPRMLSPSLTTAMGLCMRASTAATSIEVASGSTTGSSAWWSRESGSRSRTVLPASLPNSSSAVFSSNTLARCGSLWTYTGTAKRSTCDPGSTV